MDDKLKADLNELLSSNGWVFLKELFNKKLVELDKLSNIDDSLSLELQAVQIKAQKEAKKIIESVLAEIFSLALTEKKKKQSYV